MESWSFEKRKAESQRLLEKYSTRVPVVVSRCNKSKIEDIDKKKYLVPCDQTIGQMVYVIRKRIKLDEQKAIFVFIENVLPPTSALMSEMYNKFKQDDGFLYITYSGENTFG